VTIQYIETKVGMMVKCYESFQIMGVSVTLLQGQGCRPIVRKHMWSYGHCPSSISLFYFGQNRLATIDNEYDSCQSH